MKEPDPEFWIGTFLWVFLFLITHQHFTPIIDTSSLTEILPSQNNFPFSSPSFYPNFGLWSKLIECPRDCNAGFHEFIDTAIKDAYINQFAVKLAFDTIDWSLWVQGDSQDGIPLRFFLSWSFTIRKQITLDVANVRGQKMLSYFRK